MAPELLVKPISYTGVAVDIFASGVTLFMMATGKVPFEFASSTNEFYYRLLSNESRVHLFWERHGNPVVSNELKDLI